MANRIIGHFELMDLLGEGAMGRVYRARDVNLDRTVALKFLSDRTLGDTTYFERFKREARLAASLNHPNIATIYAYGEEKGEAYIAMEFVEGKTLGDVIKERGALPVADVQKYGRQAAAALALAHSRGIIHRDIKPANLMINTEGDLKVMDFGVARRSGDTEITMAGSIIGTANIMAPELIQGGAITPSADLFSLGCVLYEALAGRRAFEGDDPMAVFYQIVNGAPKPLAAARPDAPPALLQVIEGLLRKEPETRLGPAQAVADALAENGGGGGTRTLVVDKPEVSTMVLGEEAATAIRDTVVVPPKPSPFWKRPWLWAAVTVLVTAVGLWTAFGGKEGGPTARERAVVLNNEASELLTSSDTVSAEQRFRKAISTDPEYPAPRVFLGDILADQGMPEAAEEQYREAISLASEQRETAADSLAREDAAGVFLVASNNLSSLLIKVNRPADAVQVLDPAIRFQPRLPNLWKNLGLAYLAMNEYDKAEGSFRNGLDQNPGDALRAVLQDGLQQVTEARGGTAPD